MFSRMGCPNSTPWAEGFNNTTVFLAVIEAGKPKRKALPDSVSGEDPPAGLQMAGSLLCARMVFFGHVLMGRQIPLFPL